MQGDTITGEHGNLRFLARPAQAVRAEPAPVLVFLHGFDEGPPTDLEQGVTRHGPLRAPVAPEALPFVIVAPQLPQRGDLWHRHGADVASLALAACASFRGDPKRVYLTGFSFGGNGVFDIAQSHPAPWRALWAVDPTRPPQGSVAHPAWVSMGEVARWGARYFIQALGLELATFDPQGDRLYLDEGEDHVGSAVRAYRDPRVYAWLLSRAPLARPSATR